MYNNMTLTPTVFDVYKMVDKQPLNKIIEDKDFRLYWTRGTSDIWQNMVWVCPTDSQCNCEFEEGLVFGFIV